MKPIDVENLILARLRHAGGKAGSDGMTIARLHQTITPAQGGGPIWRQVANAVYRLERQGLVYIVGDEMVGKDNHPLFALTTAGVEEVARQVSLDPGLLTRRHLKETNNAVD